MSGDQFTVADITAIMACNMLGRIDMEIPATLTGLTRWRNQVFQRPSVVSVLGAPKA